MKHIKLYLTTCLLASASTLFAQPEVTAGVSRGKDYGVTYLLPKTKIKIELQISKHTFTPGEFVRFAGRYLHMNNVSANASEEWTLDKVSTSLLGEPDKENVYFVKLKDKTVAPLMELTEDGVVRSINYPFSGIKTTKPTEASKSKTEKEITFAEARSYFTEEILSAGSTAKMAELTAKEIYTIRESKNALLRGEADNMPQDGAQLKLMIDQLTRQEQALTMLFTGKRTEEHLVKTIEITPKEMNNEIIFRFSKKLGLLDKDDLAGEPYQLTIVDMKTPSIPLETDAKKKLEGIAYNVPGRAKVTLTQGNHKLYVGEMPVTQFGCLEYLAPGLFNKTQCKVQFDVKTGGLLKIDRE